LAFFMDVSQLAGMVSLNLYFQLLGLNCGWIAVQPVKLIAGGTRFTIQPDFSIIKIKLISETGPFLVQPVESAGSARILKHQFIALMFILLVFNRLVSVLFLHLP
jgi:hypothetical protein